MKMKPESYAALYFSYLSFQKSRNWKVEKVLAALPTGKRERRGRFRILAQGRFEIWDLFLEKFVCP